MQLIRKLPFQIATEFAQGQTTNLQAILIPSALPFLLYLPVWSGCGGGGGVCCFSCQHCANS